MQLTKYAQIQSSKIIYYHSAKRIFSLNTRETNQTKC